MARPGLGRVNVTGRAAPAPADRPARIAHLDRDRPLVEAAQRDPLLFDALYRRYLAQVYSFAFYELGDHHEAEDVTERTFLAALANLGRFEERGLKIVGLKLVQVDRPLAERHYAVHREKPFFRELVDFITSGPTLALVLEGEGAIATCRTTIGATNPAEAKPGSLRGRFARADLALFRWGKAPNPAAATRPP